jgi:hypothetical protein
VPLVYTRDGDRIVIAAWNGCRSVLPRNRQTGQQLGGSPVWE